MAENSAIILDLGSHEIKAGYAHGFPSEEEPRLVTPSAVCNTAEASNDKSQGLIRPIQSGRIEDWEALESLINYSLYEQLGWVEGAEGPMVMVEPAFTSRDNRELLTQLMFEVFNVSGYFATDSAVASLYGIGKLSGLVVDLGFEKIDVAPILDGLLQPSAATRLPFGGQHLTLHLQHLLSQRGVACSEAEAEKIKRECMRIAPNAASAAGSGEDCHAPRQPHAAAGEHALHQEPQSSKEQQQQQRPTVHTLPDGQTITVLREVLAVGEALITPSRLGYDLPPLAHSLQTAGLVTTVHGEKEARRALSENVLLCGGGSLIPGLPERVLSELMALAHPSVPPALCHIPEYLPTRAAQHTAWTGGAVLAKVVYGGTGPHQLQQPVTKLDYEEFGPLAVHRKCS